MSVYYAEVTSLNHGLIVLDGMLRSTEAPILGDLCVSGWGVQIRENVNSKYM